MPYIQLDIENGLSDVEKRTLVERFIQATHEAIGSAVAHINVVIREHPSANLGEAGAADRQLISSRK